MPRILIALLVVAAPLLAQEGYRLPPKEVVDIVDAPPPPSVSFSPDRKWMLLIERDSLPTIADLSRRMLRLAGMRIDPATNSRYRTSYDRGLKLRPALGGKEIRVPLPRGARLAGARWSHGSRYFVFTVLTPQGLQLWSASVDAPARPTQLADRLNTVTGGATWMPDGTSVIVRLIPEGRGKEPVAPRTPRGPNIQETSGRTTPLRTYQDLLRSEHDAQLFEHYATTQLVKISLSDGSRRKIGAPAIYRGVSPSPDGRMLLVTRTRRPFSYLMPWSSFPHSVEVWDLDGKVVHRVADIPLAESIPIGGVRTGPRSIGWRAGEPATLVWAEALDGGDPKRKVAHRDRWLKMSAPFTQEPLELLKTEQRAAGLAWFQDPNLVAASEYDRDRRWTRTLLYNLADRSGKPVVLEDRSIRDRYGNPGFMLRAPDASGRAVAVQDGPWIYRTGQGASPKGSLPFLDRQNIMTLKTERLWRCQEGAYESVVALLGTGKETRFITRRETPDTPPNYWVRARGGDLVSQTRITSFPDPTPQLRKIKKQLVTYKREDGVQLSATLMLPPDYKPGTRLPLVVWAYPREFNDRRTAGQISGNPWRFTRIGGSSHLFLLTQGYAIMNGATMPVIGDAETMNDTFINQIVMAAKGAIDKAAAMGVADSQRVVVGGHSYGAFMTANLLAHCDLFRAGLARSGAYNRTLTPFGFQSERRTLWEAKETYFTVSPFMWAHQINEPLLLIHGEADNNSGTFPMQSRRLFQAVKGHGGTARLVMLPNESHGYRARESVLHVLAEMIDWCNKHVKGATPAGG